MKVPLKILRNMKYYKETNVTQGTAFVTKFTLVMPWYMKNIVLRVAWNYAGSEKEMLKYTAPPELQTLRAQLDDWVDMQNQAPFKAQADDVIARIKNKVNLSR